MRKKLRNRIGVFILCTALLAGTISNYRIKREDSSSSVKASTLQTKSGSIVLNGDDIEAGNVNGLTYKGFGLLSGNSTSDLLMDYKSQQPQVYAQLMQYLFGGSYPIMNHVKLEMGNDCNTSTGPEACTKRSETEKANVLRNPGWQLASDAKKINPKLKISILRWESPAWANTDEKIYKWYKETILDAYEKYGYMIDYINPNINERWNANRDVEFTKKFAKWIAAETNETIKDEKALALYHKIKLVVSDEAGTVSDSVVQAMKTDKEFYNAVDVVGYHYSPWDDSNGGMKWLAQTEDKEVWNSEAQATFSNSAFRPANNVKDPTTKGTGIGGTGSALEMANTFVKGFVESRRTHVIYQPAIGSFYEGAQFSFKELVSARDPWSGWVHYDAGLLMLAHLSKFAVTGWENADNTAGIWRAVCQASKSSADGTNPVNGRNGGENYITLASPKKDEFSSVIVNDSEYPMEYSVQTKNMNIPSGKKLEVWETRAADSGAYNENYMKCVDEAEANNEGIYKVNVKPYSIVTVTTLNVKNDEEHTKALPTEGDRTVLDTDSTGDAQDTQSDYLYADDFEYKDKKVQVLDGKGGFTGETQDYIESRGNTTGAMARYTHTLNGAFEVYKRQDGNNVLRQQADNLEYGTGGSWNTGDPVTLIGDNRWTNYSTSADVLFERDGVKDYAAIGIREMGGSQHIKYACGYTFMIYPNGKWELYRKGTIVKNGTCDSNAEFKSGKGQWNNLKIEGRDDVINVYVNNNLVASYQDKEPVTAGRIALGSSKSFTQFDNLQVKKIAGYVPYYTELLDNMEQYDLTEQRSKKLVYDDKWLHTNGKGMYVYQRSISESKDKGATLSYEFTGSGIEILGEMKSICKLQVEIDGKNLGEKSTQKSSNMNMSFSVKNLEYGKHTVKIKVADGTYDVDMVGILGRKEEASGTDDTNHGSGTVSESLKKGTKITSGGYIYKVTGIASEKTVGKVSLCGLNAATKKKKNLSIPDIIKAKGSVYKVTTLAAKSCQGAKASKITIGKNLKIIEKDAFKNNRYLKTIVLNGKLDKVAKGAFTGCKNVIKVKGKSKKECMANLKKMKKSGYKKIV